MTIEEIRSRIAEASAPIVFDEEKHRYYWHDKATDTFHKMQSVTNVIGNHKEDVFNDAMVQKIAKSRGVDPVFLKMTWDFARDLSTLKGKIIHAHIEHCFKFGKPLDMKEEVVAFVAPYISGFNKFMDTADQEAMKKSFVGAEIRLGSPDTLIAGTMDMLFADVEKKIFWIFDWKTNKKFQGAGTGRAMRYPLDKYTDSEFDTYTLQLSFYTQLLCNLFPDFRFNRRIVWIRNNDFEVFQLPFAKEINEITFGRAA